MPGVASGGLATRGAASPVGGVSANSRLVWATEVGGSFYPAADGRNPFRTTWKPWETMVGWYSQGNQHPGFLRW